MDSIIKATVEGLRRFKGREFDAILENPPCLRFHPQSKDMYDFHPDCHSFAGGDCGFCYATKVESEGGELI